MLVKFLVRIVDHLSFPFFGLMLLAMMSWFLAQNGVQTLDIVLVSGMALGITVLWYVSRNYQSEPVTGLKSVETLLANGERPTLVEFFSPVCMACAAMKPIVDQLESEAGDRLQILKLNLLAEPGKSVADKYGVLFTPTFVLFDANGNRVRETVGILDRARVLHELDQGSAIGSQA